MTVETCPHSLTRTAYDDDLDMRAKISPPLRDQAEQDGLWTSLLTGAIGSLGSDHVPFFPKLGEDLWTEKPGVVSFPWELALMLDQGVHRRGLSLSSLVAINSFGPAVRFGLDPKKGVIAPGSDADIVIIDPDRKVTLTPTMLHMHDYSIYDGHELTGYPIMTIAGGRVLVENGEFKGVPGAVVWRERERA